MSRPQLLIDKGEIEKAIRRLAREIRRDLQSTNPILICILKGSFVFVADLVRALDMPLEVEFVSLSSYGSGTQTSGKVKLRLGPVSPVAGRHVLVVEDIVDTGITVDYLLKYLRRKHPASLRLCALLDKAARRQVAVPIDYLGFTVPNRFIVGYGIDWNERFRYLPHICFIGDKESGD